VRPLSSADPIVRTVDAEVETGDDARIVPGREAREPAWRPRRSCPRGMRRRRDNSPALMARIRAGSSCGLLKACKPARPSGQKRKSPEASSSLPFQVAEDGAAAEDEEHLLGAVVHVDSVSVVAGSSSYRVAPILASSGRQKIRRRESASSMSQGASANRFWRCISRTSVALAVAARRPVRSRGRMPRPKPITASTPPDPRGDPRRGHASARYSRYGVLSRPAGRRPDRAALALALARQVAPPDPALHLPDLPLAHARPCRDRRLLVLLFTGRYPRGLFDWNVGVCAGRGESRSTATARSAPTATRRSRWETYRTTRLASRSTIQSSSAAACR
jgi:hypothetical protein